jgi:hypothetical protein
MRLINKLTINSYYSTLRTLITTSYFTFLANFKILLNDGVFTLCFSSFIRCTSLASFFKGRTAQRIPCLLFLLRRELLFPCNLTYSFIHLLQRRFLSINGGQKSKQAGN